MNCSADKFTGSPPTQIQSINQTNSVHQVVWCMCLESKYHTSRLDVYPCNV